MGKGITKKESRFLSLTIASCGLLLIGSGLIMINTVKQPTVKYNYSVSIKEQKISQSKTNEIKLKQTSWLDITYEDEIKEKGLYIKKLFSSIGYTKEIEIVKNCVMDLVK